MVLALHTIKPNPKSRKKRKRVGRGNASGHGNYSTSGIKGQKARSGSSGLKLKGFKQNLLSVPKLRGFKSIYPKPFVINISVLDKKFREGDIVSPASLKTLGLMRRIDKKVKILGIGELTKKLVIEDCALSSSAREKIEKAGGEIKSK